MKIKGSTVAIIFSVILLMIGMVPFLMAWNIILDIKGQLFLIALIPMWMMLLILIIKTPAVKFLMASMGNRVMLINTLDNKYLEFKPAKMFGKLAKPDHAGGFYPTESSDVYIEKESNLPCLITYGTFGVPLDTKMVKATEKLGEMGVRNYGQMIKLYEDMTASGQTVSFNILGESVTLGEVVNYFGRNDRADDIESEIQRREATALMKKIGQADNVIKYAVILAILMIAGALAYNMISMNAQQVASTGSGILPTMPTIPSPGAVPSITTTTIPAVIQ